MQLTIDLFEKHIEKKETDELEVEGLKSFKDSISTMKKQPVPKKKRNKEYKSWGGAAEDVESFKEMD